jgi:hypothetical protein
MRFHAGDRVYWSDPDDELCSGYAVVLESHDDGTYVLAKEDGGTVGAYDHELSTAP